MRAPIGYTIKNTETTPARVPVWVLADAGPTVIVRRAGGRVDALPADAVRVPRRDRPAPF